MICPPDASAALVDLSIYFAAVKYFHHEFPERFKPVVVGPHVAPVCEGGEARMTWCFAFGREEGEGLNWRLLWRGVVPSLVRREKLGWVAMGMDGRAL